MFLLAILYVSSNNVPTYLPNRVYLSPMIYYKIFYIYCTPVFIIHSNKPRTHKLAGLLQLIPRASSRLLQLQHELVGLLLIRCALDLFE